MAYGYVDLKKEDVFIEHKYKRVSLGGSYTALIFGALVPLTRKDNVGFLLLAGLELTAFSVAGFIKPELDFTLKFILILLSLRLLLSLIYNYLDLKRLIYKGYIPYKIVSNKRNLDFKFLNKKLHIITKDS